MPRTAPPAPYRATALPSAMGATQAARRVDSPTHGTTLVPDSRTTPPHQGAIMYRRPTTQLTSASCYTPGLEGPVPTTAPDMGTWCGPRYGSITHVVVKGTAVCGEEGQWAVLAGDWSVDGGSTACTFCQAHVAGTIVARDRSGVYGTSVILKPAVNVDQFTWDDSDLDAHLATPAPTPEPEGPEVAAWELVIASCRAYVAAVRASDPSNYPTPHEGLELIMAGLGDYLDAGRGL